MWLSRVPTSPSPNREGLFKQILLLLRTRLAQAKGISRLSHRRFSVGQLRFRTGLKIGLWLNRYMRHGLSRVRSDRRRLALGFPGIVAESRLQQVKARRWPACFCDCGC